MKLIFDLPRFCAISTAAALITLLSACGQKGPLYLPPKPQAAAPVQPAEPAPVPAENTLPASK